MFVADLNQLQIDELIFCINNQVQPNKTGSPIASFWGRDVRSTGLPNSLDRDLDGES